MKCMLQMKHPMSCIGRSQRCIGHRQEHTWSSSQCNFHLRRMRRSCPPADFFQRGQIGWRRRAEPRWVQLWGISWLTCFSVFNDYILIPKKPNLYSSKKEQIQFTLHFGTFRLRTPSANLVSSSEHDNRVFCSFPCWHILLLDPHFRICICLFCLVFLLFVLILLFLSLFIGSYSFFHWFHIGWLLMLQIFIST